MANNEDDVKLNGFHPTDADLDRMEAIDNLDKVLDTIIEMEDFYEANPQAKDWAARRRILKLKEDAKHYRKVIKQHAWARQNFYGDWARMNIAEPVQMMRGYGEGRYARRVTGPGAYGDADQIEARRRAALLRLRATNNRNRALAILARRRKQKDAKYWDNKAVAPHVERQMIAMGMVAPIGSAAERRRWHAESHRANLNRGFARDFRRRMRGGY